MLTFRDEPVVVLRAKGEDGSIRERSRPATDRLNAVFRSGVPPVVTANRLPGGGARVDIDGRPWLEALPADCDGRPAQDVAREWAAGLRRAYASRQVPRDPRIARGGAP